jgi:hypothetical protein
LNGPTGPTGPANVLEIGDVTTAETDVPAAANITGSSPSQLLHLTLPKGNTGTAATIAVGTTETGAAGSSASVTNGGSSSAAVFNFTIPKGDKGNTGTLSLGTFATGDAGTDVIITNTGTPEAGEFNFTIPRGNTGTAATIAVGTTATGEAGSSASVTNGGSSSAAVFNFTIPKGDKGNTGTLSLGTVATGNAGTDVIITNTGTPEAGEFNFTIPRGNTGATGPATELSVVSTSTGAAGSEASVTISGDAPVQSLAFTIPRGDTGQTGPATQLSVASTTTGAAGSEASVTISGDAPNQSLAFTIPQGIQGIQGLTGSSGATAVLTGYVSGAGTVAATDTVIQAVGKLNGNDELKAPIASLYPYIGGKLLTYLDEEAAIADPLISAGDIYRKTAGGVDYVNPDNVPSLDLRFAADKTLTARRGPTPTFSRASSGTFVNANGLIVGKTDGTTSSITPNTQAIGSQVTVTVASGSVVGWVVGQAISLIVDTDGQDDPDATELWLLGNIVSTTDTTLVFSVTSRTAQAGSATSWTLGYRGPRFDHDPVTGVCKGLLIEESRTNLLVRSNELNISPWGPATVTVAAVAGSGLDGGNAWRLTPTGSDSSLGQIRTIAASSPHTFSVWLKSDTGSNVSLNLGVWDNTASSNRGIKNIIVTTQWQRFDITTSTVVAGNSTNFNIGTFGSWTTGENILAWGAQVEVGSFPTSYIPTTTGTLARGADVCSITGGNFTSFYNQSEGTLFSNLSSDSGILGRAVTAVGSTAAEQVAIGRDVTRVRSGSVDIGSFYANVPLLEKRVVAYARDQQAASRLGGVVSSTNAGLPSGISSLIIGGSIGFTTTVTVSAIRYYKKRLPNAKLAQLTT